MSMTAALIAIAIAVAVSAAFLAVAAYRRYRGVRIVTCPETRQAAAVEVDALHLVRTAGLGLAELRLQDCSRWPERAGCGQACLSQIADAPADCLVQAIVQRWVEGRSCVLCGKALEGVEHFGHHTALVGPDGEVVEWTEVAAERLPSLMETHQPACWNCAVAEEFRRLNPELVVDRGERRVRTAAG